MTTSERGPSARQFAAQGESRFAAPPLVVYGLLLVISILSIWKAASIGATFGDPFVATVGALLYAFPPTSLIVLALVYSSPHIRQRYPLRSTYISAFAACVWLSAFAISAYGRILANGTLSDALAFGRSDVIFATALALCAFGIGFLHSRLRRRRPGEAD